LIAYYLLKEVAPGIDPLGPDNKLIFSSGVITGIPVGCSGRNGVGAKSPLTGGWGDGQAGGFWGAELKRAGWDAIIIEGKSENPVYIWINDDKVEIRDASKIWGKLTLDAERAIQEELGDKQVRVAQIGPAGEKLVRTAGICNDISHFYGRCGTGAVMGSKKLRAIAVRGHNAVPLADPDKVSEISKMLIEVAKVASKGMTDYGTSAGLGMLNAGGILPTKNFQEGQFDGFEDITGQKMAETILVNRGTCYHCPIRCKREVEVGPPYNVDPAYGGPEYETLASFGSLCGNNDLKSIAKCNQICGAYGLDTIEVGNSIAFAIECYERGLLTNSDTGGLELTWGNADAIMTLTEMIAKREGFGDVLAEGTKRAAEKIGKGAIQYAMQVKGQELPMHEPRGKVALGLGYAVSPTGGDHMHNIHDTMFAAEIPPMMAIRSLGVLEPLSVYDLSPAKVRMFKYFVDWRHFQNCGLICMFAPLGYQQVADLVGAVTGWNTSLFELLKVGERANALMRVFNYREGFRRADDAIPERLHSAFNSGPNKDKPIDHDEFNNALTTYYKMSGWDTEKAVPTAEKLAELGVDWAASEIK